MEPGRVGIAHISLASNIGARSEHRPRTEGVSVGGSAGLGHIAASEKSPRKSYQSCSGPNTF